MQIPLGIERSIEDNYLSISRHFYGRDQLGPEGPLLAHYTSIHVLESIIRNNEIWMSNPLYMNDIQEMQFGIELGRQIFHQFCYNSELTTEVSNAIYKSFESYIATANESLNLNTYILCFTEHPSGDEDGSLSMWRGYGDEGHGAALVFNAEKFGVGDDGNFPLRLVKVFYGTDSEREVFLREWLESWKFYTIYLINGAVGVKDYSIPAWFAFLLVRMFSIVSKHKGFHAEQEWRLIYVPEHDRVAQYHRYSSYAIGKRGVEPKLKLPPYKYVDIERKMVHFDYPMIGLDLESILLGPSTSASLTKQTFIRVLGGTGYETIRDKVYSSTIPLRPSK